MKPYFQFGVGTLGSPEQPTVLQNRDDFSASTKDTLARRVGHRCSNPGCCQPTCGPQENPAKSVNVGVAAHISAAAAGGPRYNSSLTSSERAALENGIWLCQICAKLVEQRPGRYSVALLEDLEEFFRKAGSKPARERSGPEIPDPRFVKIERLMPELTAEMEKT